MGRATTLSALIAAGAVFALSTLAACTQPPRAQALVNVTTDLALTTQLEADATLSPAASIDRVIAETLDADGTVYDSHEFLFTDTSVVPISFGVPADGNTVRVRLIGFRSSESVIASTGDTPFPGASIERLFVTTVSSDQRIDIVLHGACFATPADFDAKTTCIDAARPAGAVTDLADDIQINYASSPLVAEVPCTDTPPSGAVCIPGGTSGIGDPNLATVDATTDLIVASPREIVVFPFFLDETELTVAGLRALFTSGKLTASLPTLASADARCNYTTSASNADNEAVRCVSFATARAACRARGGDLPSAAQWEHAARGRGIGSTYPWGDDPPACCSAALGTGNYGCPATSLDVGTHAEASAACPHVDVSRDGVLDLGGSVREWVIDAPIDLAACFDPGIAPDPVCAPQGAALGSTRGGSYASSLVDAASALRRTSAQSFDIGFRCVQ